ncbi:hypothetical protein [Pararhodonellum marinum]|uniref:hypothetical protein n=1 Tax=Pararhodonellum marinum TaxID=2755358 RepID=UPI0021CF2797|nr:hypothetical protein [Pararhodonellum marinum]
MRLYPKTNSWTCFSNNCSAGSGDQIEFCVKMEGDKHKGILVAKFISEEDKKHFTRVTEGSLYNYGQFDLTIN